MSRIFMRFFILFIFLVVSFGKSALAQPVNALEQLKTGNIESLEKAYSTLQQRFEQGKATEYDVLDSYKTFYQADDIYRTQLNNWIISHPNSSSAYAARGVYNRKLGEFRRGTMYSSYVPNENMEYMNRMLLLAKSDLQKALALNPKSYISILSLLNIATTDNDESTARKYLDLGNSVLPSNIIVRARYLIHLAPKWGGSYEKMDEFISESQSKKLSPLQVNMLKAIKLDDQGKTAEQLGEIEQSRSLYDKALSLSAPAGQRFRQDYMKYSLQICREQGYINKDYCK